jgi:hypothetical protein
MNEILSYIIVIIFLIFPPLVSCLLLYEDIAYTFEVYLPFEVIFVLMLLLNIFLLWFIFVYPNRIRNEEGIE